MPTGLIGVSTPENSRFSAFYASLGSMNRPEGWKTMISIGAVISENRNNITSEALRLGVDWVLYVDDDQILQPETLTKLLEADLDVISAHYTQRQSPFNPVIMQQFPNGDHVWRQLEPTERGIIECDVVGAGCLLVRRKVLEALAKPYWTLGQINPDTWGDDLDFCLRVRKAGFKVHCDLENAIGHCLTAFVFPNHDAERGWTANMVQNGKGIIAKWPMPMFGDAIG